MVRLIRYPTDEDWQRCLMLARATQGKEDNGVTPSEDWKRRMLIAGHSPIRTLPFTILLDGIPYYSAMHYVRHKVGCEWFVSSQRGNEDRAERKQGNPVNVILDCNAQALQNILMMRLCNKADKVTQAYAIEIQQAVIEQCPEFVGVFHRRCWGRNELCPEMIPCWKKKE
jgi:hypothetical protein